jgi:hypothetical protein
MNRVRDAFLAIWIYIAKGNIAAAIDDKNIGIIPGAENDYLLTVDSTAAVGLRLRKSGFVVPIGGIILWYGSVGSIPADYQIATGRMTLPI